MHAPLSLPPQVGILFYIHHHPSVDKMRPVPTKWETSQTISFPG